MFDKLKPYLIGVAVALIALLGAFVAYWDAPTIPTPLPSPTASVSAPPTGGVQVSLEGSRVPFPSQPLTWGSTASVSAARGERISLVLQSVSECVPVENWTSEQFDVSFYRLETVTTTRASYQGVAPGAFYDPLDDDLAELCPGTLAWVDLTVKKGLGNYLVHLIPELAVNLHVWNFDVKPQLPLYTELGFSDVANAYGLADTGETLKQRAELVRSYNTLLRANGVEPIKQYFTESIPLVNGEVALDTLSTFGASFKQLVLDDAIAPPMLVRYNPSRRTSEGLYRAIDKAIKAGTLPKGWEYVWDEQQDAKAYPSVKPELLARLPVSKSLAPSLSRYITWLPDTGIAPYITAFVPEQSLFQGSTAPFYGVYTACMAQGNCQPTSTPAPPRGSPMAVLDAPSIHARMFPVVGFAQGASFLLYYKASLKLKTAFEDQYNEGGNGDGTLLYPGVLASVRLKHFYEGLIDAAYLAKVRAKNPAWFETEFKKLVPDAFTFTRDWAAWSDFRIKLGNYLEANP